MRQCLNMRSTVVTYIFVTIVETERHHTMQQIQEKKAMDT